ncbi:hypothetical protein [Priestia aryabhattai]
MTEHREVTSKGDIKGRSFRISDEAYESFQRIAKEHDFKQADLMDALLNSYQRVQLEGESAFGQSLADLRSYTDKITNLFISLVDSTEDKILNERNKIIEKESQLDHQVLKANRMKEDYENKVKFLERQIAEQAVKLKEYGSIDDMIESRLKDKDSLLESKDKEIANLQEELKEWKIKGEDFQRGKVLLDSSKKKLIATEEKLKSIQAQLNAKDLETQQKLVALEKQHNDEIKAMLKDRADVEARLHKLYASQDSKSVSEQKESE